MKILLTGGTGFLGGHLKARLKQDGHEVACFVRGQDPFSFDGHDTIINCAAELADPFRMVASNVGLVEHLLEMARTRKSRLIQIGSSSETGPVEGARSENTPCRPSNLYEATKLAATNLCLGYAGQLGVDAVVARPFSLYGPGDKTRMFIPTLWSALLDGSTFHCSPGSHDWVYIDDFVDGIVALLAAPPEVTKGEIYHFGTGVSTANHEVVRIFEACAGSLYKVVYTKENARSYDVMDWRADTTKTTARLGWKAKTTVEQGINRFVTHEWFKEGAL